MKKPKARKLTQSTAIASEAEPTQLSTASEVSQSTLDLLKALPEDVSDELRTAVVQSATFVGPIPPPALFEHYDEVVPGAADRILKMAEKEQDHRHAWEMEEIRESFWAQKLGLCIGGLTFSGLIGGAIYGTYIGNEIIVGIFLGVGVVAVAGRFIIRRGDTRAVEKLSADVHRVDQEIKALSVRKRRK